MNSYKIYVDDDKYKSSSDKQKKILFTAIDLFSKQGYASTSTYQIAKSASVSEGLIFKTFGSKENLLKYIIVPMVNKLEPPKIEMLSEDKPLNLLNFVNAYYKEKNDFFNNNERVVRIFIREFIYKSEIAIEYEAYLSPSFWKTTNYTFNYMKKRGIIASWDNKYLFRALNSPLINYILINYLYNYHNQEFDERFDYVVKSGVKSLQPD